MALTSVLSACGGTGGIGAPSGASTSLRPPRLRRAKGTLMVTMSDSGVGITPRSGARHRWRQVPARHVPTLRSQPQFEPVRLQIDALDQELDASGLFSREQLLPRRVRAPEPMCAIPFASSATFGLAD